MNLLDTHYKETIKLANSLVIKRHSSARSINKLVRNEFPDYDPGNLLHTWRYYLNLAGEKHFSNSTVMINVIELDEERELTRELLEDNEYTKNELLKQEDFFKNLIDKYPEDELYIKGCMFPVDIQEAIECRDGTILNYDKNLVQYNELSLIPELQTHIYNFISRWDNVGYDLTDEQFNTAFNMVLFANIPNKIINIRLDKIKTNEVHKFHMENFFNSHFNLWDNLSIFKEETKFWLYKNLPYLIKHIGKKETLNKIVDKVFNNNDIGIGEYKLLRLDPNKLENPNDTSKSLNKDIEPSFSIEAMNASYEVDTTQQVIIENLLTDELNSVVSFIDRSLSDKYTINETKVKLNNINNNNINIQPTKILDIKINKYFKNYGIDLFKVIMDYWSYLLSNNLVDFAQQYEDENNKNKSKYDANKRTEPLVDFIDPNSNKAYSLTPYEGFLFILKILLTLTGETDKKIKEYKYDIVLNKDKNNLIRIFSKLYNDGYLPIAVNEFHKHYPKIDVKIFNQESFNIYLTNIINYYSYVWTLDANTESCITSSSIKQLFYYNRQRGSLVFDTTGKTIDMLLAENDLEYELPKTFDLMLSLNSLIKSFTNINIDEYYTKEEVLRHSKEFLYKLTAYTTQPLTTSDDVKSIFVYYNNINLFKTKNPIIGEVKADLCPYEHPYFYIRASGYNVLDRPISIIENVDYKRSAFEYTPHIEGMGFHTNQPPKEFDKKDPPRTLIEVKDNFVFDIQQSRNRNKSIQDFLNQNPNAPKVNI